MRLGQMMANVLTGLRVILQACPLCFFREHLSESASSNAGKWGLILTLCRVTFQLSPPAPLVSLFPTHPTLIFRLQPNPAPLTLGLSLTQLLEEVQEEEAHQGALVRLAESCLMLSGPCTAPPLTRWATSSHLAMVSLGPPLGNVRVRSLARARLTVHFHREKLCTLSPAYGYTSLKMTSKS